MKNQSGLSNNFKPYFLSWAIIVLMLIAAVNFLDQDIRLSPMTDEEEQKIGEFWSSRIDGGESNLPAQWFDEPSDTFDGEVKIIKTRTDNSYEENYVVDGNEDYSYGNYLEIWQDITCIDPYTGEYYELPERTDDQGNQIPIIPKILKEIKYSASNYGSNVFANNDQSIYLRPDSVETMVGRATTVKFYAPDETLCLEGIDYIKSELMESYKLNQGGRSITNTEINTKFGPIEYQFRGSIDEERRGKMTTEDIILEFKYIYYDGRFQSGEEKGYLIFKGQENSELGFTEQLIFKRTLGWDEEVQSEWNADPIGLGHLNQNNFFTKYRKMHSWYASSNGLYDKNGFFNSPENSDSNSESNPNPDDSNTNPSSDSPDTSNTPSSEENNPAPETDNTDNTNTNPSPAPEDANVNNANTPAIDSSADADAPQQNSLNTLPVNEEDNNNPSSNENNNPTITNPSLNSNSNSNSNSDNSQGTSSQDNSNTQEDNNPRNQETVLPVFNTINNLLNDLTNYLTNLVDKLFSHNF